MSPKQAYETLEEPGKPEPWREHNEDVPSVSPGPRSLAPFTPKEQAHQRNLWKQQQIQDTFLPVLEHLKKRTQNSPDLAKRDTCARLALVLLLTSRRESGRIKLFDQIRRMYGHDASTLNLEPQLPTDEIVKKWKQQIAERGVDGFDVIEGQVVEKKES